MQTASLLLNLAATKDLWSKKTTRYSCKMCYYAKEYCVWTGQATKEEVCKKSSTFFGSKTIHLRCGMNQEISREDGCLNSLVPHLFIEKMTGLKFHPAANSEWFQRVTAINLQRDRILSAMLWLIQKILSHYHCFLCLNNWYSMQVASFGNFLL